MPDLVTVVLLGAALGVWPARAPHACAQVAADEPAANRIVHRFDFDQPNYYNDVPRGWMRFPDRRAPDAAFPRYSAGRFDHHVGRTAPPSFYLACDGRSVAFRYNGSETRIRSGDYAVHGWIKPDALRSARAALSAYYLDWEGQYVSGTQRFSRLVGSTLRTSGASERDTWEAVNVLLPPAPANAHFVGITCWVVQDEVWRAGTGGHGHVSGRDVHAGAWFDDIVVQVQPRAVLTSAHAGNVVTTPNAVRLSAVVADENTDELSAELIVHDRAGSVMSRRGVAVHTFDDARASVVEIPGLMPGLYRATLVVRSLEQSIVERDLTFAVLGRRHESPDWVSQHVGIIMREAPADRTSHLWSLASGSGIAEPGIADSALPLPVADAAALIAQLGVGSVKLPIWTARTDETPFDAHPESLHELLDRLIGSRVDVIGVLGGAPTSMVSAAGEFAPTLLDVLSQDPRAWRGALDTVAAPYASIFHAWQLGDDRDDALYADSRTAGALGALHDAMRELMPSPNLATVTSAGVWPGDLRLPAQDLSIRLPADVHREHMQAHVSPFEQLGYNHMWLTVSAAEAGADAELAAWALRMIAARRTNVDRVFTPAPWRLRATEYGAITEPTPAYLVLRTLIDQLGDASFVAEFELEPRGIVQAFGDGRLATLVAWDPHAPPGGTPVTVQLGQADHVVDIWGREFPMQRSRDGHGVLKLTQSPVFVSGVEQWLVALRANVRLEPAEAALTIEPQRHLLSIANPRDVALSGELRLDVPESWEIEPSRVRFSLPARGMQAFPLLIRQPPSETAGSKVIHAALQLSSDPQYRMRVPLNFELGLPDLDVWGYAVNEGDDVRVRHGVTNRASQPLSFRAFAMLPGRSRQYRTLNGLLPGQTLTTEYLFKGATAASGRQVRLGLREVNGPRLHNLEIQVP
jgi:hypothetical protein